jgi:cytochrome c-type biogenesis protein CcmH/NrfF
MARNAGSYVAGQESEGHPPERTGNWLLWMDVILATVFHCLLLIVRADRRVAFLAPA